MAAKKPREEPPPPKGYAPESERALLGCLLLQPELYDEVIAAAPLSGECFSAEYEAIFTAIQHQHANGAPADWPSVADVLYDAGWSSDDLHLGDEIMQGAYNIYNATHYAIKVSQEAYARFSKHAYFVAAQKAANESPQAAQAYLAERLAEIAAYNTSSARPFKSIYDVLAMPKPEWLLTNYIQRKTLVALVADGGTGKSWFMWTWAMHFTIGKEWLGHDVRRSHIFYLAGEGEGDVAVRVGGWLRFHKIDPARVAPYFHFEEKAPQLLHEGETDALMARIRACIPPDEDIVIFIDTLSTALDGGDINEHKDISAFMRNANRLKIELGATVVVATHTNKQGGFLGSSALKNDTDATFLLTRTEDHPDQVEMRTLKQRGAPHAETITFGFQTVYTDETATETIRLIHLLEAPAATPSTPPLRETHYAVKVLQAFMAHPHAAEGITATQWRESGQLKPGRQWEAAKDQLEADGYVIKQPGHRGLWTITDAGIEWFATQTTIAPSTPLQSNMGGVDESYTIAPEVE